MIGQVLDGMIAVAPWLLIAIVLPESADSPDTSVSFMLVLAVLAWAVFHVLLADGMTGGQSWGKRVVGTRVIDAATGAPCTFGQAFVRNLLLSLLGPIDWLFIFGARHQRLGDKVAGTLVVPAR